MASKLFSGLKQLAWLTASCLLLCGVLFALLTEPQPAVRVDPSQQLESADSLPTLLDTFKQVIKQPQNGQRITMTEAQLDSLLGFLQRAYPAFAGDTIITPDFILVSGTMSLQSLGIERFVNLQFSVLPDEQVSLSDLKVGNIPLPGNALLDLIIWGVDQYTGSKIASVAYQSVHTIALDHQKIALTLASLGPFLSEYQLAKVTLKDEHMTPYDRRVAHYLNFLSMGNALRNNGPGSLAGHIRELFLEAQIQSNPATAHLENEAALMAMVIYYGNHRFLNAVNVQYAPHLVAGNRLSLTLSKRRDLALHFMFSAAFKLLSDQDVSFAIGEIKELMDRHEGGSGYSFVDLAADKAGVNFAQVLIDPATASAAQALLALQADESLYMPNIKDLPEGFDKVAFERQYEAVDSDKYRSQIDAIQRRITQLPISSL